MGVHMASIPGLEHLPPLQTGRSAKSRAVVNPAVADRPDKPLVPAAGKSGVRSATEQEKAFAEHWAEYRNAVQAYRHAYSRDCAYSTAATAGAEIFHRPAVQAEIAAVMEAQRNASAPVANVAWLLRRYIAIATADPRELIGLKIGCCRFCHGDDHAYQWREREYLEAVDKADREFAKRTKVKARGGRAAATADEPADVEYPDVGGGFDFNATRSPHPDCPQCHGEGIERFVPRDTDNLSEQALLLYGGVKAKREGYEIIIADRDKALEMAGRILGAFNDKLDVSGTVKQLVAVADLAKMDPQEAAKRYQDFIAGRLAVNAPDKRVTGAAPGHGPGFLPADEQG